MKQEELNEIVENHVKWLQDDGGKRADLHEADIKSANLRGADLEGADLRGANLHEADLSGADLSGADLRHANLCGADLRHADLREVDLRHADLREVDLRGANLPTGMYQVVGAGSSNRCTTYDVVNDQIVCGCWDDGKGNHLDSFIDRVESIYGLNGEKPNSVYYTEYMATINFFKTMKELKENRDR